MTGPAGIADHKDCSNGTQMAIDEINAAGGVNGRPLALETTDIDMLTPEGVQTSFQTLADKNVDAIVSPFVITYQPGARRGGCGEHPVPLRRHLVADGRGGQGEPGEVLELRAGPGRAELRRRLHPTRST